MNPTVLRLRPLRRRDELFCRYAGWTATLPAALEDLCVRQVEEPPVGLVRLAVEDADGEVVGYVDLHGSTPGEKKFGFVIGPSRPLLELLRGPCTCAAPLTPGDDSSTAYGADFDTACACADCRIQAGDCYGGVEIGCLGTARAYLAEGPRAVTEGGVATGIASPMPT